MIGTMGDGLGKICFNFHVSMWRLLGSIAL